MASISVGLFPVAVIIIIYLIYDIFLKTKEMEDSERMLTFKMSLLVVSFLLVGFVFLFNFIFNSILGGGL